MDILSTFRPSEKLLYDLFDHPQEVERLVWNAHRMWWTYFEAFNEITQAVNPGYSNWARIFSEQPHYILQSDFSFMISPDMFNQFVKPELSETAEKLTHAFYHLDGIGQLAHWDSLLEMDSIRGIQWVPGDGQPDITHWPEVYQKITNAGKKIHIDSNMTDETLAAIDKIAEQTGRADQIVYVLDGTIAMLKDAEQLLKKYNCL